MSRTKKLLLEEDIKRYCKQNKIFELDDKILTNHCIEIPNEGIEIDCIYQTITVYPVIKNGHGDINKVGTYQEIDGKVVLVDTKGKTWIAKGYWIISILKEKGYKEYKVPGPFSNVTGVFMDEELRRRWTNLKKR